MKKEELYDPVKTGSFKMMFGFPQPTRMVKKISYGPKNTVYQFRKIIRGKDMKTMDYKKIDNIEIDGIDTKDYPDFSNAYIVSADYDGVAND